MNINNIENIMTYAKVLIRELYQNRALLRELEKNPITKRREKVSLRYCINNLTCEINNIHNYLLSKTNFEAAGFSDFIVKVLNLTRGGYNLAEINTYESHYISSGQNANSIYEYYSRKNRTTQSKKTFFVISNPVVIDYLKQNISLDEELDTFLKLNENSDLICLKDNNIYPFNNDFNLKEQFNKYPELNMAINELIQLKIERPDITDNERYQIALNNISKGKEIQH